MKIMTTTSEGFIPPNTIFDPDRMVKKGLSELS